MKFRLMFKTPDVLDQLDDTEINHLEQCPKEDDDIISDSDGSYCSWCGEGSTKSEAKKFIEKFIEYGECITVEFDTDNGTAMVVER